MIVFLSSLTLTHGTEHRSVIQKLPDGSAAQACVPAHLLAPGQSSTLESPNLPTPPQCIDERITSRLQNWEMRQMAAEGLHQELRC